MTQRDLRGVPVSTDNPRALELFETALVQFHTYVGDPVATIEEAIEEAPDFVLGHAVRATLLLLASEAQYLPGVRQSLEAAEGLSHRANDRERGLTLAARRWFEGDWQGACEAWDRVLVDHPTDAFAVQAAHLTDFFLGDAVNLRDRLARVLPAWSEDTPSYSYLLGMYAFGLEECNLYAQAETIGRRALDIEPKDGWGVHAVTHVLEMQARVDEGIEWLTSREADWAPDSGFAFHNWWHLALFHLDRDDTAAALELYDRRIYPAPSGMSMQMLDASALLWRLWLQDVDIGDRWSTLAEDWEGKLEVENGYYAFNDVHALMALRCDGRDEAADRVIADLERAAARGDDTNAVMSREVGLPVARAIDAFCRGRYDDAVDQLFALRPIANRFGGSHAQRDLLSQTLIEAALRAGKPALARHFINERTALKPSSPLAWRYLARAKLAAGDEGGARSAQRRAETLAR
ncbi:MAG: tetratricopeptide repeat protein, partial [Gammaproteobacteria bacterium]|nr:tetratricopeptide repeat protein [Gammaproteobacteria bacterium]